MTYVVLARKWRPQRFEDLVGQEPITRTLENAIRLGRVSHALLLTGARGVGKTTTARIVAKAMNCEKGGPTVHPCGECSNCREVAAGTNVDVIEIDGASNTSVDDVRELIENVRYRPSKSRYKIYIIDEVHMLSTSAFNALLKTLEEPPSGVMFIFATTEPQKIPDTILSRCQRFDFRQISEEQIAAHLQKVVQAEKFQVEEGVLFLLARQAGGSLRDALSLLDQVVAFTGEKISLEDTVNILGLTDRALIDRTVTAFVTHDPAAALEALSLVLEKGFDPKSYLLEIWEGVRAMLVLRSGGSEKILRESADHIQRLREWAGKISEAELERWFDLLQDVSAQVGRTEFPRYLMEFTFLKIAREEAFVPLSDLVKRLEALEARLLKGVSRPLVSPPPAVHETKNPDPAQGAKERLPKEPTNPSQKPDWERLLTEAKKRRPPLAAILLQAVRHEFDAGNLELEYEEGSFYVTRAGDPDFQSFVNDLVSELFGENWRMKIQTRAAMAAPPKTKIVVDREREREALENPTIQKAVSLFGATVDVIKPLK